jgi:phage-related tail fiber protein
MTEPLGRRGRRADLAEQLHNALRAKGLATLRGATRAIIDRRVTQVAQQMRMTEASALKHFGEREIGLLAESTAAEWHAMQAVADAASQIAVTVPARDASQLVMGLAMAVGQLVREIYGELPAAAGEPLDALCELGAALRDSLVDGDITAEVDLETLSAAQQALRQAAAGVADGSVPVVLADTARAGFAKQLQADAELAQELSTRLNEPPPGS